MFSYFILNCIDCVFDYWFGWWCSNSLSHTQKRKKKQKNSPNSVEQMDFVANKLLVCFFLKYSVFFLYFCLLFTRRIPNVKKNISGKKSQRMRDTTDTEEKKRKTCVMLQLLRDKYQFLYTRAKSANTVCSFMYTWVYAMFVCVRFVWVNVFDSTSDSTVATLNCFFCVCMCACIWYCLCDWNH